MSCYYSQPLPGCDIGLEKRLNIWSTYLESIHPFFFFNRQLKQSPRGSVTGHQSITGHRPTPEDTALVRRHANKGGSGIQPKREGCRSTALQLAGNCPSTQGKVIIRQEIYITRPRQINVLIRMRRKIRRKGHPSSQSCRLVCMLARRSYKCSRFLPQHRRLSAPLISPRDLGQTVFLFRRRTACRWKM